MFYINDLILLFNIVLINVFYLYFAETENLSFPQMVIIFLILFILLVISILTYGSYYVGSGFYLKAICKIKDKPNYLALTFDDGPDAAVTPKILDLLKEHNAKAAFFCIGQNILENPALLQRIHTEGHIVGNHTYSHSEWFDFLGSKKMLAELKKCEDAIFNQIEVNPLYFRPPYGVTNPALRKAVKQMNYTTVGWSIRSFDTSGNDAEKIFTRITKRLKYGEILLLHDNKEIAVPVLKKLLDYCKEINIKIVRLDSLIND
jgi:peptidoglycan-N-acetylglucosamine deacetylase